MKRSNSVIGTHETCGGGQRMKGPRDVVEWGVHKPHSMTLEINRLKVTNRSRYRNLNVGAVQHYGLDLKMKSKIKGFHKSFCIKRDAC